VEAGLTELRIEHVSLTFPARHGNAPTRALEPTDLIVGNNDFVTILGPSGCGKYALLRIVAGLDRPTSGRVLLDEPFGALDNQTCMLMQEMLLGIW
jgi:NitT/TauT family transport system ATP-binding protein/sulfonate transport system ATP-binding protein